ncbi:MAG: GNAT family N-acetyltransferase [Caldilineaceae bacterium]
MSDASLTAPALLDEQHDLMPFSCGEAELDDWLKRRARANQSSGASRTYVLAAQDRVIAYYALAGGAVIAREAPGRVRRNMPDPIPVIVLGRLAVDRAWQGQGLGTAMLRDAVLRTLQAAEIIGVRASWSTRRMMMQQRSTAAPASCRRPYAHTRSCCLCVM